MTWKRVATAVVLIPFVVGIVLWGSTAIVALAVALVTLLALFEFFALGEAIGHRAYRFWTAACALLLVYVQYLVAMDAQHSVGELLPLHRIFGLFTLPTPAVGDVFFIFLMGIAILTLATRRPMVEALPAAGISSAGLLLVALPLTLAVRLHGIDALILAIPVVWYYWLWIYSPRA